VSTNSIEIYEVDGMEQEGGKYEIPNLIIENHWNKRSYVRVNYMGKVLTVLADELIRAIQNAQNAHRL
jgi:hypothetical protein